MENHLKKQRILPTHDAGLSPQCCLPSGKNSLYKPENTAKEIDETTSTAENKEGRPHENTTKGRRQRTGWMKEARAYDCN